MDVKAWTRRTFLGWFVGVALLLALSAVLEAAGVHDMQFHVGLAMAAGVALCQVPLVRARFGVASAWVWASALGMGVPFLVVDLWQPATMSTRLLLSACLGGLGAGVLQMLVLRHRVTRPAGWVLGTSLGWTLATALVQATSLTMAYRPPRAFMLLLAALNLVIILSASVVLGWVTGLTVRRTTVGLPASASS